MNGRTIVHRTLHGTEANASTSMTIHLYRSITFDGQVLYMWELRNDDTRHYWFKTVSAQTFQRLWLALSERYRFQWRPMKQKSPKSARVFEDVYFV